jgi:hypothetical protein
MSTHGIIPSKTTRQKISQNRRQFTIAHLTNSYNTYLQHLQDNPTEAPTLTGLCLTIGCSIYSLPELRDKHSQLNEQAQHIETLQEQFLVTRGLANKANPQLVKFLLQSKHKYNDVPQQLTQNNNFNITAEQLKTALSMIDE